MKNSTTITVNQNPTLLDLVKKHITVSAQIDGLTKTKNEVASLLKAQAQSDGLAVDNTIKYEYITKDGKVRHSTIVEKPNVKKVPKEGYAERIAELEAMLAECYDYVEEMPTISATPYKLKNNENA